jgi:DNA-binding transcriptional regulator LsrR (DeoR family)
MPRTEPLKKRPHKRQKDDLSPTQVGRLKDLHQLDQRTLLIAFMRAHGMTLQEVCTQLSSISISVAQNVAVTDLHQADLKKWIVTRFAREMFKEELVKEIMMKTHHEPWAKLENALRNQEGSVFKHLRVVYSGGKREPREYEWPAIVDRFAHNAAWVIHEVLKNSKNVGVCWGSTIANVITGLHSLRIPIDPDQKRVSVFPTAGQPLGRYFKDAGTDATTLAKRLSTYLNGTAKHVPSLDNVWPVIPKKFRDSADINDFLSHIDSYRDIFGEGPHDKRTLLSRADTILASCGCFHNWKTFVPEWINTDDEVDVTKVAIGDIGGALIPDPSVSENEFKAIARLWTGIRLDHFEIVARASPGVIVCAVGWNKGKIALELVRRGLVTVLVIDNELARSIEAQL